MTNNKNLAASFAVLGIDATSILTENDATSDAPRTHNLDAIRVGDNASYYPRIVDAEFTDVELLRNLTSNGINVLLEGTPGCGKTALCVAALGDKDPERIVGDDGIDATTLLGGYLPDTTTPGAFVWKDGAISRAAKLDKPVIIDEINMIPTTVLTKLHSAIDGQGFINVDDNYQQIPVGPNFVIVATMNPETRGGELSDAMRSRFGYKMRLEADYQIAETAGVRKSLCNLATMIKDRFPYAAVSIRDLIAFEEITKATNAQIAWTNWISELDEDAQTLASDYRSLIVGN
jgi:MoxR-like ATPase